jgi:hypothetical protein
MNKSIKQLMHLLGRETPAQALQKSIQRAADNVAKVCPTASTRASLRRTGDMLKVLPPTVAKKAVPMSGDALLAAGEALLKSHRINATTAAELQTAVHLGRVSPGLMQLLSDACNG